eukprot:gene9809-6885_t
MNVDRLTSTEFILSRSQKWNKKSNTDFFLIVTLVQRLQKPPQICYIIFYIIPIFYFNTCSLLFWFLFIIIVNTIIIIIEKINSTSGIFYFVLIYLNIFLSINYQFN